MPFVAALLAIQSPAARLARLAKDDGVEIQVVRTVLRATRYDFSILTDPVSEAALARYAPILEAEFRRYPPAFLHRVGLRRIVVGSHVRVEGQPRAAVPEFDRGWFWLDAEVGARLPEYGRRALDHDFFHMVDRAIDPRAGGRDPAWAALNAKGIRYGIGGWWMQKANVGALRKDLPGFLTAYSTSAVEEDKAEIFSHLLCDPAFVAERVAADPVLKAKVDRLKASLLGFDSEIDERWWKANGEN